MPRIIIESDFSESWPRLHQDMQLWLVGGDPKVQLVILVKWSKQSGNRAAGQLEVFERDATTGQPRLTQSEVCLTSFTLRG